MLVSLVSSLYGFIFLAVIISAVIAISMRFWFVTAERRAMRKAIQAISHEALNDLYVPDGMDGFIHIDCLVLTSNGVIVLDIRDVAGVIFGGAMMQEWVAMHNNRRDSFRNPLETLHDRVASVRVHAGAVPVKGYVLFTNRGRFEKGMPAETLMADELVAVLGVADSNDYPQAFDVVWRKLVGFKENRN